MKVLVTGASGLIGKKLIHSLLLEGHEVRALVRAPHKMTELPDKNVYLWSDDQVPPHQALAGCDAVIHLAGEGIADRRWTKSRKKRLWDSRILGTKNLITALSSLSAHERPKTLISGSAIGFYGSSFDPKTESSSPGSDFLAQLCVEWEKAAHEAENLEMRTVILRTGLVLAGEGGVLSKSGPVILGSGQQWMSWVHVDDMVRFIGFALGSQNLSGPYNLTAPNPVTNAEFTRKVSKAKGFPFVAKAPASVLALALGEMSTAILGSQKVSPERTLATGFRFTYNEIESALENLCKKKSFLINRFSAKQFIPLERKRVFSFFAKAENLETLTPPWLNFHIVKKSTPEIQRGTLIEYQLKIHGAPLKWKTLISEWTPESSFVDDQIKGPYKRWHHVHTFNSVHGGTLISDDVEFQVPGLIFGKWLLLPLIKKDVNTIFGYRQNKIRELCSQGII